MSEGLPIDRWFRRRRYPTFFEYVDEMMREMERMFTEELKRFESLLPSELVKEVRTPTGIRREIGPLVWGYSITVGPDGRPIIREFGNLRPGRRGDLLEVKREREPLVDVINEDQQIRVVAELPGVTKEDINLIVTGNKLTVRVDTQERKYFKEIDLPEEIDPESSSASYKNGVLEVTLRKKAPPRPSRTIKIE
ncbi:MAG: Hsp20/alpha crystallin family protein [Aigarchaeota archaeon]|nr:Hsp20/alpha crystallin family protein [Aigarchaeota archaeon]MDW8092615.1 archaeal heat shock protein Hsp20 [Nitrososphaerota archaeon]